METPGSPWRHHTDGSMKVVIPTKWPIERWHQAIAENCPSPSMARRLGIGSWPTDRHPGDKKLNRRSLWCFYR
jgi:hypothetical protein